MVPTERSLAAQRIVDFQRPPVAETALGVVFAPLSGWSVLHFGLAWERFRELYPVTEIKTAGGIAQMRFTSAEGIDFDALPIKAMFIDQSGNQLVQIQRNAFIRNWRLTKDSVEYQHYENVRPLFQRDWEAFCSFLKDEKLGPIEVTQCEVTYINHLIRGEEWKTFNDVPRIFRLWASPGAESLSASQMVSFVTVFELPDNAGTLQVVLQPGIRKSDSKEIIQFSLTATGKPAGSNLGDILKWLDLGHVAVVTSFRDLTTPDMHKYWGIK